MRMLTQTNKAYRIIARNIEQNRREPHGELDTSLDRESEIKTANTEKVLVTIQKAKSLDGKSIYLSEYMCREKMGTMLNLSIYKATIYYISRIELTYDSKRTLGLPDDSGERIRSRPLAGTQSDG
jgi:hypothetical protein